MSGFRVELSYAVYEPATFPPCREHPGAKAISVGTRIEHAGETDAAIHEPVCAECGAVLLSGWVDPDPVLERRAREAGL